MDHYADLEIDQGKKEKGDEDKNDDKPTPKDPETEQYQGDEPDSEKTQLA